MVTQQAGMATGTRQPLYDESGNGEGHSAPNSDCATPQEDWKDSSAQGCAYPQSQRYFVELKKADPRTRSKGPTWLMDL
jgi:hypothetical protein